MMKRMIKTLALLLAVVLVCAEAGALAASYAEIRLPASLEIIDAEVFFGTASIEKVIVPEGVTEIRSRAFANSSLKEITLPESIRTIADDAFSGCTGLKVNAVKGSPAYDWAVKHGYISETTLPEIIGVPYVTPDSGSEGDTYSIYLRTPANVPYVAISYIQDGAYINAIELYDGYSDASGTAVRIYDKNAGDNGDCWDWAINFKFQSLDNAADNYSRTTFLCASYNGSEWGPRAESNAFTVKPYAPAIEFTLNTAGASSTRAYTYVKATAEQKGLFSETGLIVWDANGKQVVNTKKSSTTESDTKQVWFDIYIDTGVSMEPNSSYTYQMYVVYNGYTIWTDVKSFTTPVAKTGNASLTDAQILQNLENCKDTSIMPSGKRDAMLLVAKYLLESDVDFHPVFVAGVIANVRHEGSFGKFESSAYSSNKPEYLEYMDTLYNYRSKYSGKLIYNGISLSELDALFAKLMADNYKKGKFGLGTIQWTGGRGYNLFKLYKAEAGSSDTITQEQTMTAEMKMMLNEFQGSYNFVCTTWQNHNGLSLYSDDAAFNAGYRVCVSYEVPSNTRQKAIIRGETAIKLFEYMMCD